MEQKKLKITPSIIVFLLMGILPVFQIMVSGVLFGFEYYDMPSIWMFIRMIAFIAIAIILFLNLNKIYLAIPVGVIAIVHFATLVSDGALSLDYVSFAGLIYFFVKILYLLSYVIMIAFIVLYSNNSIKNPKIWKAIWWAPGVITLFLGTLVISYVYMNSYDITGIAFIILAYDIVFDNKSDIAIPTHENTENVANQQPANQQPSNVNEQPANQQPSNANQQPVAPETDFKTELKKYQDMLVAGQITSEQYEEKRKELLSNK